MANNLFVLVIAVLQTGTTSPAGPTTPSGLTYWVQVGSICGAVLGLLTFALTQTWPRLKTLIDRRSLQKRIGAQSYTAESMERSLRYFVAPLCQDIDPAGGEEPRMVYGVKQKLYDALDDALAHPTSYKYLILLADSGMGKTTALLNYYVKHLKRWRKPKYSLALVPLSDANADDQINAIENRSNTVLLLDALDEDTLAVVDYRERLRLLLSATSAFRAVVISCRTQFFSKDEEIPKQTGQLKVSARAAGEEAEYCFHKIYLSPFSDKQVNRYISRRYPFWRRKRRRRANQMVVKMPHLAVRPMLLAHVDDLLKTKEDYDYAYELYEAMVKAWIDRERGFIDNAAALNQFSQRLAVDIYVNRVSRKSERIPKSELSVLAKGWDISLEDWKLSGRSLLNRDADGNFKFAHRSIMEYLYVKRFMAGDRLCTTVEWTDQMKDFLWEILHHDVIKKSLPFSAARVWPAKEFHGEGLMKLLSEIVVERLPLAVGLSVPLNRQFIPLTNPTRKIIAPLLAFILDPEDRRSSQVSFFARHPLNDPDYVSFVHVFSFKSGDFFPAAGYEVTRIKGSSIHQIEISNLNFTNYYDSERKITWLMIGLHSSPLGLLSFDGHAPAYSHLLQEAFSKAPWLQRPLEFRNTQVLYPSDQGRIGIKF